MRNSSNICLQAVYNKLDQAVETKKKSEKMSNIPARTSETLSSKDKSSEFMQNSPTPTSKATSEFQGKDTNNPENQANQGQAPRLQKFQDKNLQNSLKNSNFANQNERNDKRTKARMDNRRGMENNALHRLVGEQPQGERLYRTIDASNNRGSDRTAKTQRQNSWNKERFLGKLEIEARKNQTWIDDISSIADVSISKGQENEVYRSQDGKKAIKVNNLSLLDENHNFDSFIDRLTAHNELFNNVPYKIIGFAENSVGEVGVVLEQPYVKNAKPASQNAIDDFLKSKGFKKSKISDGEIGWTNGKYELWDAEPKNVLIDKEGNLYFIDTVVNHVLSQADTSSPAVP